MNFFDKRIKIYEKVDLSYDVSGIVDDIQRVQHRQ